MTDVDPEHIKAVLVMMPDANLAEGLRRVAEGLPEDDDAAIVASAVCREAADRIEARRLMDRPGVVKR